MLNFNAAMNEVKEEDICQKILDTHHSIEDVFGVVIATVWSFGILNIKDRQLKEENKEDPPGFRVCIEEMYQKLNKIIGPLG